MRSMRKDIEIFSLSFLDIVACAFGAIVLIIILAKDSRLSSDETPVPTSIELQPTASGITSDDVKKAEDELEKLKTRSAQESSAVERLRAQVKEARIKPKAVASNESSINSIYNGGIPAGREHIIFIIDTSGSMQQQWGKVKSTLKSILAIHPTVTGLQILDDNGNPLLKGYDKRWIPDTKTARDMAMARLDQMGGFSNSSPAEGLERALKVYASQVNKVSVFVMGDDFTGDSYDKIIQIVQKWNRDEADGKTVSINAIGFPGGLGDRYGTLMRALAEENDGAFVGLPATP
jgi:hypothetical protein